MIRRVVVVLCALGGAVGAPAEAAPPTAAEASQALRRAVDFFRKDVSASGAYLWRYAADLSKQEGEGRASKATAWVQPPGTPSVGGAFLFAYEATGDKHNLQAARETAHALVQGQLRSGGWDYRIEFADKPRRKYAYRVAGGDARSVGRCARVMALEGRRQSAEVERLHRCARLHDTLDDAEARA